MNESKQRGFLKGTLMEQSMNFYLFISILASSLVQRAGLGNKKNMLPQRNKEGKKKKGKEIQYFCRIIKNLSFWDFSSIFFLFIFLHGV